MSQYFLKPYQPFGGDINVKVDLSNHAAKANLKNATGNDTSKLAVKSDLASSKTKTDGIDIVKLKTVTIDLSKLSSLVNNDVVKKTVPDKLVTKVNKIDSSEFVLKTKYDTDKSDLEKEIIDPHKKIPDTSWLVKKHYNLKVSEIKSKIPNISRFTTFSALTAVENKISDASNLVKETDYDAKITDIEKKVTNHDHDKYITTLELNWVNKKKFTARLAQTNLLTKTDFDNKLKGFNKRINSNKTKYVLIENELKKLQKSDSSYFWGIDYLENDGTQNYLVFNPIYKYFKTINFINHISAWKSKGLPNESINSPSARNNIRNIY